MSRVEKAAEPSMEEILASIRKIISEEPASARPSLQATAAPPPSTPAARQEPAPALPNGGLAALAAGNGARKASPSAPAVDDVLDALSNDIPTRTSAAPPQKPAPAPVLQAPAAPPAPAIPTPAIPSPATPAAASAPLDAPPWLTQKPQGAVSAGDKRPTQPSSAAPQPQSPARDMPRPFFSDLPTSPPTVAAQTAAGAPFAADGPQRRAQVDFGAVVPGRGESLTPSPSLPMPHDGPARAIPGGTREELVIVPHTTVGGAATANGHLNGASRHREPAPDTRHSEPQRSPAPAQSEVTGGRRPDPVPHSRVVMPMSPSAAGLNGSAPLLSAARSADGEAQQPAKSAPEAKPAGAAMNGSDPKDAVATPAADGAAKSPAAPVPAAPAAAPAPTGAAVALPAGHPLRTMEDTVAELLRPMLRQWLDANMPRIVEKALRVELAESAKKKH